jgi:hypothetical protein
MRAVSKEEALEKIPEAERTNRNRRLIRKAQGLYLIRLEDAPSFLSLIFVERLGTRILVPGQRRSNLANPSGCRRAFAGRRF